jgi:hypothetical protein
VPAIDGDHSSFGLPAVSVTITGPMLSDATVPNISIQALAAANCPRPVGPSVRVVIATIASAPNIRATFAPPVPAMSPHDETTNHRAARFLTSSDVTRDRRRHERWWQHTRLPRRRGADRSAG